MDLMELVPGVGPGPGVGLERGEGTVVLAGALAALESFSAVFAVDAPLLGKAELLERADLLERASRVLQHAQVIAAHTIDVQNLAATGDTDTSFCWDAGAGRKSRYRSTGDFLVGRLRISRFEANRRVFLGRDLLPATTLTGQPVEPRYPALARVAAAGQAGTEALSAAAGALGRARVKAGPGQLAAMENLLAEAAVTKDPGAVAMAGKQVEYLIDQDGNPPGEEELRTRQGVHYHGHKRGLEHLEIFATQAQYEVLATVMNTGTNPRTQTGAERAADGRTGPQRRLDALTGACQAGLAAAGLPSSGGIRPQVLATIDYDQLLDRLQHRHEPSHEPGTGYGHEPGHESGSGVGAGRTGAAALAFTGPVAASHIRQLACDADIIPVVMNGEGRILDLGRGARIFSTDQRLALAARDGGCTFPLCTMPVGWTEAHHVDYWHNGGRTDTGNGAMLCSWHHHLIHQGHWRIDISTGIPWFIPPPDVDPDQKPLRNTYFRPQTSLPPT